MGTGQRRHALGQNLTYRLLDEVGGTIVSGHYEHLAFPTEAELAREHSVSRTVAREAVKMLTTKGLLSAHARRGTVVQPTTSWNLFDPDVLRWMFERSFSIDLLWQFAQVRMVIEPAGAALAAKAATEDDLAMIASRYEDLLEADQRGGESLEAAIAFHVAILGATANLFYAQFGEVVETALRSSIGSAIELQGASASQSAYYAVLDAIEARDSDRAHAAMTAILSDVVSLIDRASLNRLGAVGGRKPS